MANLETQIVDDIIVKSRRKMLSLGGTALAGMMLGGAKEAAAQTAAYADTDILNFALNLEYLEANFYYLAAFGTTIDVPNAASVAAGGPTGGYALKGIASGTNPAAGGAVVTKAGGPIACKVPFTTVAASSYCIETAIEEGKHVNFLYTTLGSAAAVAQPPINLDGGTTSPATAAFNALVTAAGIATQFDPFGANSALGLTADNSFLLGAYVFEDVGVTAYHGAAPLITQTVNGKIYLQAAAGILAVEAYHAGLIRTSLNGIDAANGNTALTSVTTLISALRAKLSAAEQTTNTLPSNPVAFDTGPDDYGIATKQVSLAGGANVTATQLVDADQTYVYAFARSTSQVLNIVTGGGFATGSPAKGVFYPAGMNGLFK